MGGKIYQQKIFGIPRRFDRSTAESRRILSEDVELEFLNVRDGYDLIYLQLFKPASVLDPRKKLAYFQKTWPKRLQNQATKNMEETVRSRSLHFSAYTETLSQFKERYLKMHASEALPPNPPQQSPKNPSPSPAADPP
jgi:hypothetical protein